MRYRDYHQRNLIEAALNAYDGIPLQSRTHTVPFVTDNLMRYEEYQMFLDPVNRLVEMGELDFEVGSSLDDIVKILRKLQLSSHQVK